MRKTLNKSKLIERTMAVSLVVLLAAIGCTTNRNPGPGEPYVGGPGLRPTSTSGNVSSAQPSVPPPMTSSYTGAEALPAVKARSSSLPLTADEAAAVIAGQQPRVKVLGPASPGTSGGYHSDGVVTGQPLNWAAVINPQSTVNSSLSSQPTPVVTSGVGGSSGGASAAVIVDSTGVTTANSTVGNLTTGGADAAVFNNSLRTVTPTNAAIPLTPGMFAAGGTTLRSGTTSRATRTVTPVAVNSNASTSTLRVPVTTSSTANSTVGSGNVRVQTMNGRTVISNQ